MKPQNSCDNEKEKIDEDLQIPKKQIININTIIERELCQVIDEGSKTDNFKKTKAKSYTNNKPKRPKKKSKTDDQIYFINK